MAIAAHLNRLAVGDAEAALTKCCASPAWVREILSRRPFADDAAVHFAAAEIWNSLDREQWLAAFAAHPKIGDVLSLKAKYANTAAWASGEQAGTLEATEETLKKLADGNRAYEAKFGHIFIVCATGKSATEMLALLEARLSNNAAEELAIAAAEQLKITQLRLGKLGP
jgi:2-oxo-4-hydroxy-4-carboxy-5-ureidoimidazoline decarboxylase